jgi:TonB family protein
LTDSVFAHAALLGLLYAVSIWPQATIHLADSRSFRTLSGYRLSQYLPELHGAPTHRKQIGKADPVLAPQEIRSLPDSPDNLHQTIVTPRGVKLQHDVDLPNLASYAPPLAEQPLKAITRSSELELTGLTPRVETHAPEIVQAKPQRALPKPNVAQSAPEATAIRRGSALNLAQLLPPVAKPLPGVAPQIVQDKPQRVAPRLQPAAVQAAPELGSIGRGSPPNVTQLLPPGANAVPAAPQVLALNAHPADLPVPAAIPEGTRRGAFAASPTGHANATGAPGAGDSPAGGKNDAGARINAPAGISVGASPLPVAAAASPDGPSPKPGAPDPETRTKLMAAMRPPAIASIPPRPPVAHENTGKPTDLENHIFAGRRSYTLAVNMPNLNSATGSWIIHFVDRDQGLAPAPIVAPEVLSKFDPAYPIELMRDGVNGAVILTAIIRADGTVSDIVVARSVDPQLDQNAVQALSRWVFRPALKNGQAIDLQAVITVPFRTKPAGF